MKVLIVGGRGYLGQEFLTVYPEAHTPSLDIADPDQVQSALDDIRPDVVINAAGKTGRPNVDWCEDHKAETVRANITGPLTLLDECAKRGIYWVHLSSGCIYEGDNDGTGFAETDAPNFSGSFYARSKTWIELILKEFPVLILRLRMPFDGSRHDRNLISKLLRYDRVLDVQNSLTYMPDFLAAAEQLIEKRSTGIFNVVNPGTISPYGIMEIYRKTVDAGHAFERLPLDHLSDVVKAGRSNCVLSTTKLQHEGIRLRPVDQAIEDAVRTLGAA